MILSIFVKQYSIIHCYNAGTVLKVDDGQERLLLITELPASLYNKQYQNGIILTAV